MSGSLRPRRARGSAFAPDRTDLDDVTPTAPSKPLGELMPKLDPAAAAHPRSPRRRRQRSRQRRGSGPAALAGAPCVRRERLIPRRRER